MMMHLRAQVLFLLVGSAASLNHLNFIGGGNFNASTASPEIIDNYLEFFTRVPPEFHPPTTPPTLAPVAPTPPPTSAAPVPTSAPIPAGRFPSPVAPTPAPTWRRQHPVNRPTPSPAPTWRRQHPVNRPTPSPTSEKTVDTRTASYTAEWGSDVNHCQEVVPNVFFECHEGGVIQLNGSDNSMCMIVADDRIQCRQENLDMDSSIGFSCSGIRKAHVMATATVGPNVARDCAQSGKIVKYLTLARECDGGIIDVQHECNGGMPYESGGTFFCASPAVCGGPSCDELKLEPLSMSNTNLDLKCSHISPLEDLHDWTFTESHLSSVSVIDWRISGKARGCEWKSPELLVKCEDGGRLHFEEDYSFCSMLPDGIGKCESFSPYSTESEESIDLMVKCSGKSESQLVLSVEVLTTEVQAICGADGTIIQSIMLSRGCGEIGSEEFFLVNHPSYCDSEDQVFAVDEWHAHCFVGNTCIDERGCHTMQIPMMAADTGSGPHERCTYIE